MSSAQVLALRHRLAQQLHALVVRQFDCRRSFYGCDPCCMPLWYGTWVAVAVVTAAGVLLLCFAPADQANFVYPKDVSKALRFWVLTLIASIIEA